MGVTDVKQRPGDIHKDINVRMLNAAVDAGVNFSRFLEELDPSTDYAKGSVEARMSAFERQLEIAGIVTTSDPEGSYIADDFDAFDKNDVTRILGAEFIARQYRKVAYMGEREKQRAINMFGSDDYVPGSFMRPIVDAADELVQTMEPQIPLSELVAKTTPIDGDSYRAMYVDWGTANLSYSRIAEGTEIPSVKIVSGERPIMLHKYGVKVQTTYEQLRRVPIDLVAILIQRIAIQAEVDKVTKVMDVMINGDGNSGTAATSYNLTTLDPSTTANNETLRSYMAFRMKFRNPYRLTTILAQEAQLVDLAMIPTSATATGGTTLGTNGIGQINIGGDAGAKLAGAVNGYVVDTAPTSTVVGFDGRVAIERVVEVGGTIQEMARWMNNQTEELYLTEVEGYRVLDPRAVRLMVTNA